MSIRTSVRAAGQLCFRPEAIRLAAIVAATGAALIGACTVEIPVSATRPKATAKPGGTSGSSPAPGGTGLTASPHATSSATVATASPSATPHASASPSPTGTAGPSQSPAGGTSPSPSLSASSSPNSSPSPSQALTPDPAQSGTVGGDLENSGTSSVMVRLVVVDPATISLNAPASDGTKPAGFPFAQRFTARVIFSNGQTDDRGVTWAVSDSSRVQIDDSGRAQVMPGAGAGAVSLTATSKGLPATKGNATVHVTSDGLLRLAILPPVDPFAFGYSYFSVSIVRNSLPVLTRTVSSSAEIRLPAASGYQVNVMRISQYQGDGQSASVDLADLAIQPNAVTEATATLPTPAPQ